MEDGSCLVIGEAVESAYRPDVSSSLPVSIRRFPSKLDRTRSSRIKLSNSASEPAKSSSGKPPPNSPGSILFPKSDKGSMGGGTLRLVVWVGLTPLSRSNRSRFKS